MLFKNAIVYTYSNLPVLCEELIKAEAFAPCGTHEAQRGGFIPPFESLGSEPRYIEEIDSFLLMTYQVEEKILPPSVVREVTNAKVKELEERENRTIYRKEREGIKDDVIVQMLARAFTKKRRTSALLDLKRHLLIVDASSHGKAEEFCHALRVALGSLPVQPIRCNTPPSLVMTDWLKSGAEENQISLLNYCKLQDTADKGATVVCRNEDLHSDQVETQLAVGRHATELSIRYDDAAEFVLTHDLKLKSIAFSGEQWVEIADQADGDKLAEARATAFLCGRTIEKAIEFLCGEFGGAITAEMTRNDEPTQPGDLDCSPGDPEVSDPLYAAAVEYVVSTQKATIPSLKRHLLVGYNRAARLIEAMESLGVVSPTDSRGTRSVQQQVA